MHVNGIPTADVPFNVDLDNFDLERFCNCLEFAADHQVWTFSEFDSRFPSGQAIKTDERYDEAYYRLADKPDYRVSDWLDVDVWHCEVLS